MQQHVDANFADAETDELDQRGKVLVKANGSPSQKNSARAKPRLNTLNKLQTN